MGFWSIFSSSDKAVEAAGYAVKKGIDGIDHLWYSPEEKAENAAKHAELVYKFGELALKKSEQAMGESTAQTLSRRYMAWFIVFNGGALSWFYIFAYGMNWNVTTGIKQILDYWEWSILAVVGFYFTAHALRAFKGDK